MLFVVVLHSLPLLGSQVMGSDDGINALHGEAGGGKRRKTSRGRCKIPIAKIQCKTKNHVAFSKRRQGLFKKASELCVLSRVEIAIITFSEAGKVFTFGHPSADAVIDRYLSSSSSSSSSTSLWVSPSSSSLMSSSNPLAANLDGETMMMMTMATPAGPGTFSVDDSAGNVNGGGLLCDGTIEGLGLNELEGFMSDFEQLRNDIGERSEEENWAIEGDPKWAHVCNFFDPKEGPLMDALGDNIPTEIMGQHQQTTNKDPNWARICGLVDPPENTLTEVLGHRVAVKTMEQQQQRQIGEDPDWDYICSMLGPDESPAMDELEENIAMKRIGEDLVWDQSCSSNLNGSPLAYLHSCYN